MSRYISVLMYHRVGNFKSINEHRALYCKLKRFSFQMWFLNFFKYNVISLTQALYLISSKQPIPPKCVVLTFDDGYYDFYKYAYPILKKYKFPATVYVLSELIGKKAVWFEKENRETPFLLTKEELLNLSSNDIEIGSHGKTHVKLSEISLDKAEEEIMDSKRKLEKLLNKEIIHFCYPYGKFNKNVIELVKKAGYRSAVTCIRGGVTKRSDPYILPRKAISFGDSLIGFLWKIHIKNKPKVQS